MCAVRYNSPRVNLNLNVRGLQQSATLRINELSQQLIREGRTVYKLGLGQSPFPVPPVVVEELKTNAHQKDYLPVLGLRELRGEVAEYFQRTQGLSFSAEDVMVGPGSKELMFILQLVYYGDLLIPNPSWVSYAPQASIIGRKIQWMPTHITSNWHISAPQLERICQMDPDRPRLLILNYPSNPAGTTYTMEELKALARVARQYGVVLLSDEIYGELHHNAQHVSIARFYPEGTIVSSGLSKWCGAGGWRLGVFLFPKSLHWIRDAMAVVASETYTSTSAPIQYAAVRAFEGGLELEHYLQQSRRILRNLGRTIWQKLKDAGVTVPEPRGGFYLFPDFSHFRDRLYRRGITTSQQFAESLLKDTGVALLPGHNFGRPEDEFTARIAYVDFDGARALAAAETIPLSKPLTKDFLYKYCERTLVAIDKLIEWLNT